ncbi:MAG: DUF4230 domain-containing protein [Candidatus Eisenbacteria bacterium]
MEAFLIGLVIGVGASAFFWLRTRRKRTPRAAEPAMVVQSFVTQARAVAELSVYRIRTKEIITASDHWLGEFGKKYLTWLFSKKHMTMIFEFVVDFRYSLTSPDFGVELDGGGECRITVPAPNHEVQIMDMLVHSEGKTELLPWLMPDLLERVFTGNSSVDEKNRLIAEAKQEAHRLAARLVQQYERDAQLSATRTLETMARGFGLDRLSIHFLPAGEFRPHVDASNIERALPEPDPGI